MLTILAAACARRQKDLALQRLRARLENARRTGEPTLWLEIEIERFARQAR